MKAMSNLKQFAVAAMVLVAGACWAQAANVVSAQFGQAPESGQSFTVNLVNTGAPAEIAGFAFKLVYNPAQVSIAGVADNTGQPAAKMQYTVGPEVVAEGGASASVIIIGNTAQNLKEAGNLAEIKFTKKAGYTAPLQLSVQDRVSSGRIVDGLLGPDLANIPHTFDSSQVSK